MALYFSSSLNTTENPTLGYIKWTPHVVFNGILIDIVFGHHVRQGMGGGGNCHQKWVISSLLPVLTYLRKPWFKLTSEVVIDKTLDKLKLYKKICHELLIVLSFKKFKDRG